MSSPQLNSFLARSPRLVVPSTRPGVRTSARSSTLQSEFHHSLAPWEAGQANAPTAGLRHPSLGWAATRSFPPDSGMGSFLNAPQSVRDASTSHLQVTGTLPSSHIRLPEFNPAQSFHNFTEQELLYLYHAMTSSSHSLPGSLTSSTTATTMMTSQPPPVNSRQPDSSSSSSSSPPPPPPPVRRVRHLPVTFPTSIEVLRTRLRNTNVPPDLISIICDYIFANGISYDALTRLMTLEECTMFKIPRGAIYLTLLRTVTEDGEQRSVCALCSDAQPCAKVREALRHVMKDHIGVGIVCKGAGCSKIVFSSSELTRHKRTAHHEDA